MSDRIIFKQVQKQYDIQIGEDSRLDRITKNFIHELVTDKGTSVFDKEYGTNFIPNLGTLVNKYKVDYYLQLAFESIAEKHEVDAVTLTSTAENANDGFLELYITLTIGDMAVSAETSIEFDGNFTAETIIEQRS